MNHEAANKRFCRKLHELFPVFIRVVPVSESDYTIFNRNYPVIADGYAMSIPRKIFNYTLFALEGFLEISNLLLVALSDAEYGYRTVFLYRLSSSRDDTHAAQL